MKEAFYVSEAKYGAFTPVPQKRGFVPRAFRAALDRVAGNKNEQLLQMHLQRFKEFEKEAMFQEQKWKFADAEALKMSRQQFHATRVEKFRKRAQQRRQQADFERSLHKSLLSQTKSYSKVFVSKEKPSQKEKIKRPKRDFLTSIRIDDVVASIQCFEKQPLLENLEKRNLATSSDEILRMTEVRFLKYEKFRIL